MENIIESEEIKRFITIDEFPYSWGFGFGYGDGYTDGSGYGYGFSYGSGSVNGCGYNSDYAYDHAHDSEDSCGYGCGYGRGSGYVDGSSFDLDYGDGRNVEYLNGQKVYKIDKIPTLIDSVHGNYAKGRILQGDLTTSSCFIAKKGNFFAHGETLKQAFADVVNKFMQSKPIEERIAEFNRKFPDRNKKYPAYEFFLWHNILTGSCLTGRKLFCEQNCIDYINGEYSVNEFIFLTRNAYGGEIIKKLEQTHE